MTAETFLRIRDVERITGLPPSSIYELVAKGQFPKQVRLSPARAAWIESEIAEWQAQRVRERDEAAAA